MKQQYVLVVQRWVAVVSRLSLSIWAPQSVYFMFALAHPANLWHKPSE
jgi:hypothetical protein